MITEVLERLRAQVKPLQNQHEGTTSVVPFTLVEEELTKLQQHIDNQEAKLSEYRKLLYHAS